jgi:hypothetical protein
MTLAELIASPPDYAAACEIAIILTAEQASIIEAIQAEYGNPRHVAAPVDLIDGRKMLSAALLTEIAPGGLYSGGFAHLPEELFSLVEVISMSDAILLLPQTEEEL